ncbi:MAG TPA: YciI family protein [Vicinamibacterales bacterium]|nr:YciI family protein [Vicinamibacterales bacterium]
MTKRFVYFYLMRPFPKQVQLVAPAHVEHWKAAHVEEYRGGPFADRSGGLIEFVTQDVQKATDIVRNDPFVSAGLVEASWLKEWIPE